MEKVKKYTILIGEEGKPAAAIIPVCKTWEVHTPDGDHNTEVAYPKIMFC